MRGIVRYLIALIPLTIVFGLLATLMLGFRNPLQGILWGMVLGSAGLLLGSALVSAARRWSASAWVAAGLLVLLGLCLPASMILKIFPASGPEPFSSSAALTLFLIPSTALIAAALILYSGLKLSYERQEAGAVEDGGSEAPRSRAGKAGTVLLLGTLLLAKALHSVYWLTIWDGTYDSLGFLWLIFPIFAAIFSGVLLANLLTGRMKQLGLGYALLIPALLIVVSTRAQRVDFRRLTEVRAERASQAIERYSYRHGSYPENLRQLPPWTALSLPGPTIIFGQDWCYDGGGSHYRLGYVDREHWSDPRLIGRIYRTEGELPDLDPICAKEVAALQARDPQYPYSYWKESE